MGTAFGTRYHWDPVTCSTCYCEVRAYRVGVPLYLTQTSLARRFKFWSPFHTYVNLFAVRIQHFQLSSPRTEALKTSLVDIHLCQIGKSHIYINIIMLAWRDTSIVGVCRSKYSYGPQIIPSWIFSMILTGALLVPPASHPDPLLIWQFGRLHHWYLQYRNSWALIPVLCYDGSQPDVRHDPSSLSLLIFAPEGSGFWHPCIFSVYRSKATPGMKIQIRLKPGI